MSTPRRTEAVVIGAGLAGLAAAWRLQEAGLRVQVIEAQDRVGGRVHSMGQTGGNREAGGTYIGAGYRRVIGAARRHDVELVDVTPMLQFFREQELVLDGELIRQSQWAGHPANPFPEADRGLMPWTFARVVTARENPLRAPEEWLDPGQAHNDVSLHDWMRGLGLTDPAIEIGYGLNVSFGDHARDVSALLLLVRAAFSVAQRRHAPEGVVGFTAADGVQRIPEAMAEALANEVHFGKVVRRIDDTGGDTEVRCADGTVYRAPHVVCSLPFGVLREVGFDPPLTGLQHEAAGELPYQAVTQVYLAPRSRFWEQDGAAPSLFTDGPAGMLAATRDGTDPAQVTSFTAWSMGPNAQRLDALPPEEAGRLVIREIESVRPAARGQLEFVGLKSWGADSFARGAWAYFRPGQINRFAKAMGQPHGRIRFCGEHLARGSRGMEGAMESGEQAAGEILGSG